MFSGLDLAGVGFQPPVTWDYVKRLKETTTMRLVIKGIVTREDAALAVTNGADAIICSNHGGRAEETGRASIESLPEVLEGAAGRVPVLVDSGFRRGTDIFTALALGATAICIGRPYVWGLAAFGQEGVEVVLDILTREPSWRCDTREPPRFRTSRERTSSSGGRRAARYRATTRESVVRTCARPDCPHALPPAPGDRRTPIE